MIKTCILTCYVSLVVIYKENSDCIQYDNIVFSVIFPWRRSAKNSASTMQSVK